MLHEAINQSIDDSDVSLWLTFKYTKDHDFSKKSSLRSTNKTKQNDYKNSLHIGGLMRIN